MQGYMYRFYKKPEPEEEIKEGDEVINIGGFKGRVIRVTENKVFPFVVFYGDQTVLNRRTSIRKLSTS